MRGFLEIWVVGPGEYEDARMTDVTIALPVPAWGGIPAPIKAWLSRRREERLRRWMTELGKHARADGYARGSAELLEEARPGSVARLDAMTLNISSKGDCALGQEYGDFDKAPAELKNNVRSVGFNVPRDMAGGGYMNLAWKRVIVEYRAATA